MLAKRSDVFMKNLSEFDSNTFSRVYSLKCAQADRFVVALMAVNSSSPHLARTVVVDSTSLCPVSFEVAQGKLHLSRLCKCFLILRHP